MRKLTNKQADKETSYSQLLTIIVGSVPQQGLTISEQKDRISLLSKVDVKLGEEIVLEEADANIIKGMVKAHKFTIVSKELVAFGDDVENMEEVSLKALQTEKKKTK